MQPIPSEGRTSPFPPDNSNIGSISRLQKWLRREFEKETAARLHRSTIPQERYTDRSSHEGIEERVMRRRSRGTQRLRLRLAE